MKSTRNKFSTALQFLSNYFHYFGLILGALLIHLHLQTSEMAENTLNDSIRQQQAIRNLLWVNLVTQRASVLSLSPLVTRDVSAYKKAAQITGSIPDFLNDGKNSEEWEKILLKLNPVFSIIKNLNEKSDLNQKKQLLEEVEHVGIELNAEESKRWYDLIAKNTRLLKEIRGRHLENYLGDSLFMFYMFVLAWVSTKKKKAELHLKQSERKGRVLTEGSFEGLVILDGRKIIEVNPAFETMFETDAENAIGKEVQSFVAVDEDFLKTETTSKTVGNRTRSGKISVEASTKQLMFENKPITILALRDLSERNHMELLKLEKEAAERSNHAKSTFLANMSHELRTPMHGILSFAKFGQQKTETASKEKLKSYFDEIHDSGSRLMTLLNDLLDLSKLESGKTTYSMRKGCLKETLALACSEMKAFSEEKGLTLFMDAPSSDTSGDFDAERILQVARNLLSNAIKFSEKGTTIRIKLDSAPDLLRCEVSNRGVGIPQPELEAVFDKFVQSSKTRTGAGGTGLGLAISKEIIQQHQGRIWAENSTDGETIFTFEFPKCPVQNTEAA